MDIDVGYTPVGTPPTGGQQLEICAGIGAIHYGGDTMTGTLAFFGDFAPLMLPDAATTPGGIGDGSVWRENGVIRYMHGLSTRSLLTNTSLATHQDLVDVDIALYDSLVTIGSMFNENGTLGWLFNHNFSISADGNVQAVFRGGALEFTDGLVYGWLGMHGLNMGLWFPGETDTPIPINSGNSPGFLMSPAQWGDVTETGTGAQITTDGLLVTAYDDENVLPLGTTRYRNSGVEHTASSEFYEISSDAGINIVAPEFTVPTPAAGDNSIKAASTEWVRSHTPSAFPLYADDAAAAADIALPSNGLYKITGETIVRQKP